MRRGIARCGLLLRGCPLEHWNKNELIRLIVRLVLHPKVDHVEITPEFRKRYDL